MSARTSVCLAVVGCLVLVSASLALGANLVVTNVNDGGAGSLRAALDAANASPGSSITFDPSLSGGTIALAADLPQVTGGNTSINGDTDGDHRPDVVIDGGGLAAHGLVISSSNNAVRYLAIRRASYGVLVTDWRGSTVGNLVEGCTIQDPPTDWAIFVMNASGGTTIVGNTISNVGSGIVCQGSTGCTVRDNVIRGIRTYYAIYSALNTGVTVEGNRMDGGPAAGIYIASTGGTVSVSGNTVDGGQCAWGGQIIAASSSSVTIANNTVNASGYLGILMMSGSAGSITGNTVSDSKSLGICVEHSGTTVTVTGNTVDRSKYIGIGVTSGGVASEINHNTVIQATNYGIIVNAGGRVGTISSNVVRHCGNDSILVDHVVGDVTIADNAVTDFAVRGIYCVSGSTRVTGNSVSSSLPDARTCIWAQAGTASIASNQVSGAASGSIGVCSGCTAVIESNTVGASAGKGIKVAATGTTAQVLNNTIQDVAAESVYLCGGATGSVQGNSISRSKGNGIALVGTGTSAGISGNTIADDGSVGVVVSGGAQTAAIDGNTVTKAASGGIAVTANSQAAAVSSNHLSLCGNDSILLDHVTGDVTVSDNTVTDFAKRGIYCWSTSALVTANKVSTTLITVGSVGIQDHAGMVTISNNEVSGASWANILACNGANATIQDNNVGAGGGTGGIVAALSNTTAQVLRNTVQGGSSNGIHFCAGASGAAIGNTVYGNQHAGVAVLGDGARVTIAGNSIYDNGGLGIDLNGDGVTPNGPGGTGPNKLMNYPVVTSAENNGGSMLLSGTAPAGSTIEVYTAAADPSGFGEGKTFLKSVPANGDGTFSLGVAPEDLPITMTATDAEGNTSEFSACRLPWAPELQPVSAPLDPTKAGNEVSATCQFTDPNAPDDVHTAEWTWGDETTSDGVVTEPADGAAGSIAGAHTYPAAGVYTIQVTVTDQGGLSDEETYEYVVVYNPDGGFVTGGGWITSPAGAYPADASLTGKANFGFNSKYQHGASVPTGDTQFQFKVADLDFHSTVYEWLVIAGAKAQYRGSGKINGAGDYRFLLTAIDGQVNGGGGVDKFRIKIWTSGGGVVYDNKQGEADDSNAATEIGGGSIVIHKDGSRSVASAMVTSASAAQTAAGAQIVFTLTHEAAVSVDVVNIAGRPVRQVAADRPGTAGVNTILWDGRSAAGTRVPSGRYLVRVTARSADGRLSPVMTSLVLR